MQTNKKLPAILSNLDIKALNHIQEATIKAIQREAEVFLLAPTGSGKTLAFLLPILDLLKSEEAQPQCLILVPSRELAIQIEQVWRKMGTGFKVNSCYGGHDMQTEIQNLKTPPALLIGTPGRIADHISRNTFVWDKITTLVLDEFDKSLSMGFEDEMSYIIKHLTALKKRVLVSATTGITIPDFTGIVNPQLLDFTREEEKTTDNLIFKTVISEDKDKVEALFQLLCYLGAESTLIFCNHRDAAERTSTLLNEKGIQSTFFHGGMEQIDRERTLVQFRNGSVTFLVASDLAARGLDIAQVKNVIHYHLPLKREDFTHRNGRTARMNAEGTAYIILHKEEPLPHYLPELPEVVDLPQNSPLPEPSRWATVYISGGKKDKLNKVDIVGFLSKKGNLSKEDLGLIEVMDFMSFAAVNTNKVKDALYLIRNEKMKGKRYKIELARR